MALTANTPLTLEIGGFNDLLLATGAHPFEGSGISVESDGYARTITAGDTVFAGHAVSESDNSAGSSGDKSVRTRTGIYRVQVTLSGVAQTNVGDKVYMTDDNTYTLSSAGSAVLIGLCVRYVTTDTCIVECYPFMTSAL